MKYLVISDNDNSNPLSEVTDFIKEKGYSFYETEQLDDLTSKYESIFNFSPISIVVTDTRGIIESVNPMTLELTGYTASEVIGKKTRIFKSDKSNTDIKNLWKTISAGNVWRGEFINSRKDGSTYTELSIVAPIKNNIGEITHYVALKEDVSALKFAQNKVENSLKGLEQMVEARTTSLLSAQALTLESLATLSEYRDNETGAHIKRTKFYVKLMLDEIRDNLNYTDAEIDLIWHSAPLHDIGKVGIPDHILLKPGKLTEDEFAVMKEHVRHGNEALMRISEEKDDDSYLRFAKEITLFHHEKWNGTGYPYGLTGEDIPISARVMALADVYDALRSSRPYKEGLPHKKVVEIILKESEKHFDPMLIDVFKEKNEDFNDIFLDMTENTFDFSEF